MCGIAGFFRRGEQDQTSLKRMADVMVHRGPDDEGFYIDEGVHLAHRRLSIVDLSTGHQPMHSREGSESVVFNGEIYNHLELRSELGEELFQTHSDTEVLLYGYRKWGVELFNRLNGMFSLAIYDKSNDRLVFARDRLGQKPLYYSKQPEGFAFASELKPLFEVPFVQRKLRSESLPKYFAYEYLPVPETLFEGVWKCPPGHWMILDLKTMDLKIGAYWQTTYQPLQENRSEGSLLEEFDAKLKASLEYRMMADVPLGVFLSGGLDSSTCLALLREMYPDRELMSFSVNFENKSFDESSYSSLMADRCRSIHHEAVLKPETMLEVLPHIESQMLDPIADASIIPTYLLCSHARQHAKVAIGGDAADELLGGYPTFQAHDLLGHKAWPVGVQKTLHKLSKMIPTNMDNLTFDFKIKQTLKGLGYDNPVRNQVWLGACDIHELKELFPGMQQINEELIYSELLKYWKDCNAKDDMNKINEIYMKTYMNDDILVKVDRASMMNSLEVRAPFLDVNLVEFINSLPHHMKRQGGNGKKLLKNLMRQRLPDVIIDRPKKGFGMPISHWFRGPLKDLLKSRIEAAPEPFDRSTLERWFHEHQTGQVDRRKPLFAYFMLQPLL
jgi:asparagine synthase (glutamine-hydrolysing)